MSAVVAAVGLASCAQGDALVARDTSGSIFGSDDAGDGGDANEMLRCATAECPAPYGSCGLGFPCTTDLSSDEQNCGACGNVCPSFEPVSMRGRCLDGACILECFNDTEGGGGGAQEHRDCNRVVDDGCEVDVFSDERNCGGCGNACPAGVRCIAGRCGCPSSLVDCDGRCVDLATDMMNCGTCGKVCVPLVGGCTVSATMSVCRAGSCSPAECIPPYFDCDGDLDEGCGSNGCEAILGNDQNCGGCGIVCVEGTECRDDGAGMKCLPKKPPGTGTPGDPDCGGFDLLSDPRNCGACGVACLEPRDHESVTCEKGVCVTRCDDGFADCNANPRDGCEMDLLRDPANCGVCGNRCSGVAGQPCVEGKCLTKECAPGQTQ